MKKSKKSAVKAVTKKTKSKGGKKAVKKSKGC